MKRVASLLVALFCANLLSAQAQIPAQPYSVSVRGPHHQVLEAPSARPGAPPHRIVELATGMHYWSEQEKSWIPSAPVFDPTESGFIASRIQHRVQVASDLNVRSAVTLTTPGGAELQSTPLAIALAAGDKFQVIGVITNCTGVLIDSNQVLFANAFAGAVCADVVLTLSQASYEADVVFTARLDPADYGFPRDGTTVQILTEFYQAQQPEITRNVFYAGQEPQIDEMLTFGEDLVIGLGEAYVTPSAFETNGTRAPVTKEYRTVDQRVILFESVDFRALAGALLSLPECDPSQGQGAILKGSKVKGYAALPHPSARQAKRTPAVAARRMAQASVRRKPGVTIDYRATLTSGTTLKSDTTYLVAGAVYGGITIEGGTVLKYKTNACINTYGSVICKTVGPYRPAIFTCVDDDTIGETMQGYAGSGWTGSINPNGYANPAIDIGSSGISLNNCLFRYAASAIRCGSISSSYNCTLSHVQFVKCVKGIELYSASGMYGTVTATLNNVLLSQVQYPFYNPGLPLTFNANATHCTMDQVKNIVYSSVLNLRPPTPFSPISPIRAAGLTPGPTTDSTTPPRPSAPPPSPCTPRLLEVSAPATTTSTIHPAFGITAPARARRPPSWPT